MSPEAQRIAIAQACGHHTLYPLDYLKDLNAMHEAEKVLTHNQLPNYTTLLINPVLMKKDGVSDFDKVHATAAQRAEAFLRTLGLWKETDRRAVREHHDSTAST